MVVIWVIICLGLFFVVFDDLYSIDLVVVDYFCFSLGLFYCYVFSSGFNFDFLSSSQEIG